MVSTTEYNFDSLNLQVGSRLQLQARKNDKVLHYFTTVVGYIRDEFLLIKTPTEDGAAVFLREGEVLSVRVFSGISICSFVATVDRVFVNQFSYVHLSFPTAIQGRTLRKNPRISVSIPAHIGASEAATGTVINLSVDGALVESSHKIPEEAQLLDLSFELLVQAVSAPVRIKTQAVVRNIIRRPRDTHGEIFHYGVQFKDMDPMQQLMLQNMTYEALIEGPQKLA